MKIKKIRAATFREALVLVRKELGEDAMILSSDDRKNGRAYVEVTAAVDYDNMSSGQAAVSSPFISDRSHVNDMVELKKEITGLKESIEMMQARGFEIKVPEDMKKAYRFLRERSISEEFAFKLLERATSINDIEGLMSEDIKSFATFNKSANVKLDGSESGSERVIMLIGPTGVGKTTTTAKLASRAIREGKKVAIISLDTYKIGAAEQIRIYSRMIGIPLDIVSDAEGFKKSVNRFSDKDLIIVDTAGKNPGDPKYIKDLNEVCNAGMHVETHLLFSASSDGDFLADTHRHYGGLPIDSIAFTKTDEAVKLGSIYNLSCLYKKPVAYITNGQTVPGNIEFVDSMNLTNLILTAGSVQ